MATDQIRIAVLGLGYVGLPLALALARRFKGTVGFDINAEKVAALKGGRDVNNEGYDDELRATSLAITDKEPDLRGCNFFIIGVPTPVDANHNPDMRALTLASATVGRVIIPGSIVVYESTVYPGVTEDLCGPVIEEVSGLKRGKDFKLGYSPERMNPGDKEHSLASVVKVVSGEDAATLDRVAHVYSQVVTAGVHRAPSIKVAEAAKVIENTQRDLNIALMNELAIIFERMRICTKDVLDAAATKWNFLRFSPGLVGGHCIGVDPYYLTAKAEQLGYHPQVILAGRRINDGMGAFVAQKLVKLMVQRGLPVKGAQVGILGLSFKENVTDIRNSRVPDIVRELEEFGVQVMVSDPHAEPAEVLHEYGVRLASRDELRALDGLILAVAHREYMSEGPDTIVSSLKPNGVFVDIKSVFSRSMVPSSVEYWCL